MSVIKEMYELLTESSEVDDRVRKDSALLSESTLKLWRKILNAFDSKYVGWSYVRDVTSETSEKWLAVYKKDEPNAEFVISASKPHGKKGKKVMTGRGSTE